MKISPSELSLFLRTHQSAESVPTQEEKNVLIRTKSAGVHFAPLACVDYDRRIAHLKQGRRVWSWEGAFTLSAVAKYGPRSAKLSCSIDQAVLEVIEVIPCNAKVATWLTDQPDHDPSS